MGIAKITETFLLAEKKSSVMITMASARETLFANVLEKLPNKRKDTAGIQNIPRVEHIDATDGVQKQTETNPSSFERPIENPNKPTVTETVHKSNYFILGMAVGLGFVLFLGGIFGYRAFVQKYQKMRYSLNSIETHDELISNSNVFINGGKLDKPLGDKVL